MFDWSNWLMELIISTFFISGFFVAYFRVRGWMLGLQKHNPRIHRLRTSFVLTSYICVLIIFCVLAANQDPGNASGYLNWAMFILVTPLLDDGIGPVEFLVRGLITVGLWISEIDLSYSSSLLSVGSLLLLLVVVWVQRGIISKTPILRLGVAAWLSSAFWLTQNQLTSLNVLMNIVMFMIISLFSLLFWSSERLSELERGRLVSQVNQDTLTGAGSYFAFKDYLVTQISMAQQSTQPLAMAMYDLDMFKAVNDTYGHQAGNKMLTAVTHRVQTVLKNSSLPDAHLYRTGGEEFNIVFANAGVRDVQGVCESILDAVRAMTVEWEGETLHITLSMGLTELQPDDAYLNDFYERVDSLLYNSKQSGRDQLTIDGAQLENSTN
ncbi:GGDEF domain-containing protein [Lacticaseibacillus pabuli]|uniref:GGDEF domain-containing protein n=1 Tax=Lacticaseibacillus pabuli TaxID=3025672 RepID=A0ABY7WNI8_9LACO|nr:GGDEF domain-containing protein [Lacticaseibacillus sp. KACC 23028]WDF81691.1 GGDEF domain-containing protein [Lacticaseibacillus sp. KACC 23028]